MILSDYHLHSEFSGDSTENIDELVLKAIDLGLKEIAVTDHLEYDMEGVTGKWILNLDRYVEKLQYIREKYKGKIDIKLGLEAGVQPHTKEYIETQIKKYPFDFVIASGHGLNRKDISFGGIHKGRTKDEVQTLYFENLLENVKVYENYCVYGHLDFITRYGGEGYRGLNYEKQKDIIDEILKMLISKNKGIEINTSGFRYNEDRFYPLPQIVKRYFQLGGEILTVGSDAHRKEDIARDFNVAADFLESIGQKYICSFTKMKPEFVKI